MTGRPYVLMSCATSMDGYIDVATDERLLLSNDADFERVDAVRATVDAILVGSNTIRKDNPRLLVRSAARRDERVGRGLSPNPTKVTITGRGELDPDAQFFTAGDSEKIVYAPTAVVGAARSRLGARAQVVDAGESVDLATVLSDLSGRGIGRLMVEGGGTTHTRFLTAGLVDELHLVIAPFFVGDSDAARFAYDGTYPFHPGRRARLLDVARVDDVALLRYALSDRCPG